jgi:cell division protein FtsI/penicillin-binding protein 2
MWAAPNYADTTTADYVDGEDLVVRRAAVDALGGLNGAVVVSDPNTGRILSIVNQRVALSSAFIPCSTIKVVAGLAGLSEGIVDRNTQLVVWKSRSRRRPGVRTMNLTEALAVSNNPYFMRLGEKLGFQRIVEYARMYGLGEYAGINIPEEHPGQLPAAPPSIGVGYMTSFGTGFKMTALQLSALMGAIANGGTLYYQQYPRSQSEMDGFVPQVKRRLPIAELIPEVKPGLMGATTFGSARRSASDPDEPILGKTGTCTDNSSPVHMGWFGSFNEVGKNKIVVVVMLTGADAVNGPVASGVAGRLYRSLSEQGYFEQPRSTSPVALISTQSCCTSP